MGRPAKKPTVKNPPANFTGEVRVDPVLSHADGQRASAANVRFSPGPHSNWHPNALGKALHVAEGVGLVQTATVRITWRT